MTLKIFTSNRSNGSMKSINDSHTKDVNQSRANFLEENHITPTDTTLVYLTYSRNDYIRYFSTDNTHMGDGIVRESTLVSDALVTTKQNHALFLPLADCIGAVLYDPDRHVLMMSHLGRHNLEQYGGRKSVEYLIEHHKINPSKLTVWLSPAAGKDSYPVFTFDNRSLHDVAIEQLCSAGVPLKNIEISPIDSAEDTAYYSHSQFLKGNRTEDGRFAIVAVLTD